MIINLLHAYKQLIISSYVYIIINLIYMNLHECNHENMHAHKLNLLIKFNEVWDTISVLF